MTIHKAKGLEFPHVFVPGFVEGAFPGGPPRGQWPSSPVVVPWQLRDDATEVLRSYPGTDASPTSTSFKAYQDELRALQRLDTERLAYVALTRAERTLVVTGHWWGATQQGARDPEPYLGRVHEASQGGIGAVVTWHPRPEVDVNPHLAPDVGVPWPALGGAAERVRELAAEVRAAAEQLSPEQINAQQLAAAGDAGLSAEERAVVAQWDEAARLLLTELRAERAPHRSVPLPPSVSASVLMRAIEDPGSLALDLARPMPAAVSPASARGTAFHTWVETQYGQQSLLDPDDLPGAADSEIASDEALEELKAAFSRSAFAQRAPHAVEQPFALVLGGRVVRGRIDAVFAQNGRFDVIDWKTGAAEHVDPVQLAIYRLAWAQIAGVPVADIDAGFLIVRSGEVLRPALPDLSGLTA